MEATQEIRENSFIVRNSDYSFPLEREGRTINRRVLVFPELDTLKKVFGEDPRQELAELIKENSDSKIAEKFSTEDLQFSTFSIIYLRRQFRLGENKIPSEKGKISNERIGEAVDAVKRDIFKNLEQREQAAIDLGYLISPHSPTMAEMTRLLGFKNHEETTTFLDGIFKKISKTGLNVVK